MQRFKVKITLKGSQFFEKVIKKIRSLGLKIYICNRKKGVLKCELREGIDEWLEVQGIIFEEIPAKD